MPTENIPDYLKPYICDQDYESYTARDHASWRYIMLRSRDFFKDHALSIYLDGLAETGIETDRIPRVEDIDAKLSRLGWRAVAVTGFIPPAAFLDFQARKILPIATDMRSIEHLEYTPAPDIVHEAAGHAPIIADASYSAYLTKYAAMAQKAIFVKEDLDVYEAIRTLSDMKENSDFDQDQVSVAEKSLENATKSVSIVSEAAKTARMNWWTVEYGLMGSLEAPKIFGAGLLSSLGESQSCLSEKVKKIPLSIDCTDRSYDITEPQPQLYVAKDMDHLISVLEEFESTLSFRRGGVYGMEKAKEARTVTTTVLQNGLQISGILEDYEVSGPGEVTFVKFSGPTQISKNGKQLNGHSRERHGHGFSSPLDSLKEFPDFCPNNIAAKDLAAIGINMGSESILEFASGIIVKGTPTGCLEQDGKVLVLTWKDCTVKKGATTYFEPEWGEFDMIFGAKVVSVFGGPADRESYGMHDVGTASTEPGRKTPFSAKELRCFDLYSQIRKIRLGQQECDTALDEKQLNDFAEQISGEFPEEWLLHLILVELEKKCGKDLGIEENFKLRSKSWPANNRRLFEDGLKF